MSKTTEEWKPIVGYEGLYEVSDWGNVRSVDRYVKTSTGLRHYKEKILTQNLKEDDYYEVSLYNKGEREHRRVNRLVAESFIPNPDNKTVVGHDDCDRKNNKVENLYWCTQEENNRHPITNERQKNNPLKSKHIFQYSLDGKLIAAWPSINEAARQTGFNNTNIGRCCIGKQKTSNGYKWSYEPL